MNLGSEYSNSIIKCLIYIEHHLDEELGIERLAKVACYSPFHFRRIFHAVVGETLHHYIKRLRLERAAGRLKYTSEPVTDIALGASYETPSAFTRAFREWMGRAPTDYRSFYAGPSLAQQQLEKLPMIQPDTITTIPELQVLFVRRFGPYTKSPWDAWQSMGTWMREQKLNRTHMRYFTITHDDPVITPEEKMRCDACILPVANIAPQGEVGQQRLLGGSYAVFTHRGPYEEIESTFLSIFARWLPTSSLAFDDTRPPFSEHLADVVEAPIDPQELITKIYIPVL